MTNESKARTPPYASYASFDNFLTHLREHPPLPPRIDKSFMSHLNYGTQQALVVAMRSLGLITEDSKPTERLEKLIHANGADRSSLLLLALKLSYPYFYAPGFDLERATADQFAEKIRSQGVKGSTVDKCIAFFIAAANAAGIKLSPHLTSRKRSPRATANGTTTPPKRTYTKRTKPRHANGSGSGKQDNETDMSMVNQLLEKFPDFDPKWEQKIQERWFAGFERLMDSAGLKEKKA
ncbi:MAG: DUF5343 domain-containing protein [Xanthobacteraceae bacterium]